MATVTSSKRQLTHTSNTYESNGDVTIGGNLNINGTTTTIDTANLLVEDKNIIIGDVTSPSDTTADGGGITLKGASDKTINWVNSTDSWTSNQRFSAPNLTLTSLSTQSSETTALVVNGSNVVGTRELGSAAFSATSAFAAASHTHSASDITSGTLNGSRLPRPLNGDWWNGGAVIVGTDGVMEVGKYLDFHTADSGGGTDYDVRVTASSSAISVGGSVTATSFIKSGGTTNQFLKANGNVDGTAYAPLASPALTGSPTAPTQSSSENSTKIATTAYVKSQGYITSADGGNATTLDGIDSSSFLRSDANDSATGTYIFSNTVYFGTNPSNAGRIEIADNSTTDYKLRILGTGTRAYELQGSGSSADFNTSFTNASTGGHNISVSGVISATGGNSTNWNTAYGWGNHASAGYVTTDTNTTYSAGTGISLSGTTFSLTDTASKLSLSGGTLTGTLNSRDIKLGSGYHLQRSDHHSGHLEGSYNNVGANAGKSNPIYTIGSNYNPSDAALGSMYGIGYSHTDASFISFTGASGWGQYVAADGDARIFLCGSNGVISSTGEHYVGSNRVFHAGYHPNADTLTTARTISLAGDVTGSVSFNGSSNVSITTVVGNDSHTHDSRYYTETETNGFLNLKANLASPTFTGTVTVGGILKDGEYHNAGSSSWKTKKYVRSVGVTGADIQGVWVYLARVVLDGAYEKARIKFNINSYDDVASGVEAIDVSYENGASSQEHHILNWYSTDGNATTFSEVRSIRSSSSGLSNTYDLYVQMSGDWRDTFTVVAESWVSNGSSTPITFPTSAGSSTAPTAGSDDKAATSREWYTSNSQMYSGTNKFWHAGNDGSGSGLDADLLDGVNGASFARSDAADTFTQRMRFDNCATNNHDTIATTSSNRGGLEIYNSGSGNDAFMAFHASGDFACYFGLDADNNKLSVGGWSMGANKYEIYHSGNKPSLATLGYTGATNANYITNNNQLTNGAGYAPLASPALTGNPTAPTQAANNNSTRIATTAYVQTELADLIGAAPAALDTLSELADAINDDSTFSSTVTTALGNRLRVDTASQGLNSTQKSNARTNLGLGTAATSNTSAFLGATAKAADSNLLDGIDSSSFLRSDTADTATGNLNFNGIQSWRDATRWQVSASDDANQRADARDDDTDKARLHWYGKTDSGTNTNFRHAWYDGSAYVNVDVTSQTVTFDGAIAATGGNSTNWNTAYADRNKWDGGSTGLNASTGRTSLGLGSAATQNTSAFLGATAKAADSELLDGVNGDKFFRTSTNPSVAGSGMADTNLSIGDSGTSYAFVQSHGGKPLRINPAGNSVTIGSSNGTAWHSANDGSGSGLDADLLDGLHASSFNQVIGTDSDINTSGATVIDQLNMTDGVIQSHSTRTLTLANLGYTGATNANNYSLPEATATSRGGIELFSNTDQSVAANSVSATSGRTYGIQLNSAGQAVVNVPWSDTNTDTNTTYTAGSGLTLSGTEFSHADTSSQSSSANSGRTYIQSLNLDGQGHVTGLTTATETVVNTDTNTTYSAGRGLDLSGTEFQLETDLRDSISYIGYDSNDYLQWSNNSYVRAVVSGTERFRVNTSGIDVNGTATASGFQTDTTNTNYNLISRNGTSFTLYVQAAQSNSTQPIASFRYGSATANGGTETFRIRKDNVNVFGANFTVGGSITGNSKNFSIPHPTKEGKRLVHSCLEGPEIGVYFRGRSTSATIEMPDYWAGLVHLDSMTVELTAIGPNQDLYVEDIADDGDVTVGSNTETALNYFYVVYGERKDLERLEVEIDDTVEVEESSDNSEEA